ncbi:hypothetical protein F4553_007189 [Allocatelliglobosispora scoriae]|uniref:Uncharacterized protein n=1 Tax=Allocatelliglobosispora scoriae TaxID=643052 RepID=A0A841C1E9_9ACTN|nr:hypothetical protein [Allocatelliglobosispora scoriae]MBB5873755.1 hypothetical protein [Allocatelliglobosispora scoriae]
MRPEPTVWSAILSDPALPFDPGTLRMVVRDQRGWSRRWLYPVTRVVSRLAVALIVIVKRVVPVQFTAHATMDRLCVWFIRRFVSPEAATMLIRHFIIETNLLVFAARNAGLPGLPEVALRPTSIADLGNRAVIEHDINVYDVLISLGVAAGGRPLAAKPIGELDCSMLTVPPIDVSPGARRWLRLDIQTALCLMNIPFALCLSSEEYRRAVHSLRLDESVMAVLSTITGDPTFRTWSPAGVMVRVDSTLDVPRAVYEHAVICEYAHAYLLRLRAQHRSRPLPATVSTAH